MNCCRRFISFPILLALSSLFYTSTVGAQMRKIYVDPGGNDIRKFSFYSPSEGYISTGGFYTLGSWVGYTTDSGRSISKKYITTSNVDYANNPVAYLFNFNFKGVKAFSQDKVIVYGDYGFEPTMLYSTDGCNSFKVIYWSGYTGSLSNSIIDMIFPENNNTGYAIDDNRIIKTNNQGISWSVIKSFPGYNFSNLEAADNNNVFVLGSDQTNNVLLKTTNAGASWQNVPLPSLPGYRLQCAHFLTSAIGWINMDNYNSGGYIYKTIDGGNTWTLMNNAITAFTCSKMKFTDGNTGYAVSGNSVYKTINSGKIWEALPRDNDFMTSRTDLQFISANQFWAGGNDNFIEMSTNGGGTPVPKSFCSIDTTGFASTGIVALNNYSRTDYTYKWFVNNILVSTAYNATYTHNPDLELDTIKLVVSNGVNDDTRTVYQSFYPRPRIISFTPLAAGEGTDVTINGVNFTGISSVSFGGVNAATFTITSPTTITAVVGAGASGIVKVLSGAGKDSLAGFSFIPPPVISDISPLASVAGTTVTITGSNFSGVTAVNFGGVPAVSFTIVSPTVITAITPSGGSGVITITSAGGTQIFPGYIALPAVSAFSPSSGTQGSILVIAGTSLTGITSITVGGINVLSFTINSSTSITAKVGAGATGNVVASKPGGSASMPGYTYYTAPVISSFTPASGPTGTAVVITGTGFNATAVDNVVYFGAVKAIVSAASTTSLTVKIPVGATFDPISVLNLTSNLTAYSEKPFLITYPEGSLSGYTYGSAAIIPQASLPQYVSLTDIDGDGKSDIIVSAATSNGADGEALLYRNTSTAGNAVFQTPVILEHVGFRQAIAADLDGDGKPDLAILSSDPVATYLNTSSPGNISFTTGPVLGTNNEFNQVSMAVADADGDGKPDIVTSNGLMFRNISTVGNISFEKAVTVFGVSRNVLLTDLNGDNKPDLVYSDNDNVFYVLKNSCSKGTLSFEPPLSFTGFSHTFMVAGDIDGDGKTDIISADYYNAKLGVFRNTGSGGNFSFDNAIELPAPDSPFGIAVSDIDGDGKPDIAATLQNYDLAAFKNSSTPGTISFLPKINFTAGTFYGNHIVALGDIDGDGKNDAVTSISYNEAKVSVHLNTFSSAPSIDTFAPASGKLGDTITITGTNFNNTTAVSFGGIAASSFTVVSPFIIKAIVSTGTSGNISVTTSAGTIAHPGFIYLPTIASFTPASGIAGTVVTIKGLSFSNATNVSFGDAAAVSFTKINDTIITAIVGNGASGKVIVTNAEGIAISTGDFTFIPSLPPFITSVTPIAADAGATITVTGSNFSSSITGNDVYFGTIKAQVVTASANSLTVVVPHGAVYEHVMVRTNYLTAISPKPFVTTFMATQNFTAGSFVKKTAVYGAAVTELTNLHFKDMNGDNLLDAVVAVGVGFNMARNMSTNNGQISFTAMQNFYSPPVTPYYDSYYGNIAVADFDGDGKQDIAQVSDYSSLGIRRNISTAAQIKLDTFVNFQRIGRQPGGGPQSIAVADINADGKPDVVTRNASGPILSIYINRCAGASLNFADPIDIYIPAEIASIKVEDIDNDLLPDLVVATVNGSGNPQTILVFRNTTTGNDVSFDQPIGIEGNPANQLQIADMDGDNKPDIVAADYLGVAITKNTSTPGNISFGAKTRLTIYYSYYISIGLNDLNGDGKPDIFLTQSDLDSVAVYQNTSSGGAISFADRFSYEVGKSPDGVISGDVDGDGKPDIGVVVHNVTDPTLNAVVILKNLMGSTIDSVCAGSNTTLHASNTGANYQWQQNTGAGFSNITGDSVASGTDSASLQLTNVPASYNGYQYKCIVDGVAGDITTLVVSGSTTTVTITIATTNTSVCAGATVTFTATPSAGVVSPSYQWQVNGANTGTNNANFTSTTLANNSQVKCIMTVTNVSACSTAPATVNSNIITLTVNSVAPAVVINGTTTVTKDSSTVITATATNGGTNPVYQWQDSTGSHAWQDITGTTNNSVKYKPLSSGDKIRCTFTSNASCANPATLNSNVLVFTVNTVTAIDPVTGRSNGIRYYPNPVSNLLVIDSIKLSDLWQTLDIVSTNGDNSIIHLNISNQTQVKVNVEKLAHGFYVAVLRRKEGAPVYLKFIKL